MNVARQILIGLCIAATTSCAPPGGVRARNQENLIKLSLGMTKAEVLEVMGTETITTVEPAAYIPIYGWALLPALRGRVPNPYRTEMSRTSDGTPVLIIFYLTDERAGPMSGTADEDLTPLVLENDRLVGWGWNYLERNVGRYRIQLQRRH